MSVMRCDTVSDPSQWEICQLKSNQLPQCIYALCWSCLIVTGKQTKSTSSSFCYCHFTYHHHKNTVSLAPMTEIKQLTINCWQTSSLCRCVWWLSSLCVCISLRPLDVEFMKALHEKVNIVPVLAKADTLTPMEVKKKKIKASARAVKPVVCCLCKYHELISVSNPLCSSRFERRSNNTE